METFGQNRASLVPENLYAWMGSIDLGMIAKRWRPSGKTHSTLAGASIVLLLLMPGCLTESIDGGIGQGTPRGSTDPDILFPLGGQAWEYDLKVGLGPGNSMVFPHQFAFAMGVQNGSWMPMYGEMGLLLLDRAAGLDRFPNPLAYPWSGESKNPTLDGRVVWWFSSPNGSSDWVESIRGVQYQFSSTIAKHHTMVAGVAASGEIIRASFPTNMPWSLINYRHDDAEGRTILSLNVTETGPIKPGFVYRIIEPVAVHDAQITVSTVDGSRQSTAPVPPEPTKLRGYWALHQTWCEADPVFPSMVPEQPNAEVTVGQRDQHTRISFCNDLVTASVGWQKLPLRQHLGDVSIRIEPAIGHIGVIHSAVSVMAFGYDGYAFNATCACFQAQGSLIGPLEPPNHEANSLLISGLVVPEWAED